MVTQIAVKKQKEKWQLELQQSFTDINEFLRYCNIDNNLVSVSNEATKTLRFFVTKHWADKIVKGDSKDPLLLQVLPQKAELEQHPGYSLDPLEEQQQSPAPGVIHKYKSRILLTLTQQCGIYCRYCFRRHFAYENNRFNQQNWQQVLTYLKNKIEINEVILSGGDPLILPDKILQQIMNDLSQIAHLKFLRIHSRLPLNLPSRLTNNLITVLNSTRLKAIMVLHTNCAAEINNEVSTKLANLHNSGITLFNQTVLLKNINDNPNKLADLSYKLFENDVIPYYIHSLDKVTGSAHFEIPRIEEKKIINEYYNLVPGYLAAKFVTEKPYAKHKIMINLDCQ